MTLTEPTLYPVQNLGRGFAAAGIATEDWDVLFRAALELLARVAFEQGAPEGPGARLQARGTALRECVDALDQLRRSALGPSLTRAETRGSLPVP